MLNYYTVLCLLALGAFIQSMPTNDTNSAENVHDRYTYGDVMQRFLRDVNEKIDGSVHFIKSAGVTYTQRLINGECFVQYDGKLLAESSVMKIRKKVFRVEACVLERVYHACGPNLVLMLGVVCRFFEQEKTSSPFGHFKREANLAMLNHFEPTANKNKRVITESCCENLCSISELTRYCHD